MMMGTVLILRISVQTAKPSFPGIITSGIARSQGVSLNFSSNRSPFGKSSTV